jgi:hypothetical protein
VEVTRTTIRSFRDQIPRTVFVDSSYVRPTAGGSCDPRFQNCLGISSALLWDPGSRAQPYSTLNEGLKFFEGVALVIHPGHYPEKITIHTPMRVYNGQPRSGVVRIGQ